MDKFKARLVVKGYHQIEGVDYNYLFSPVAKLVTIRLLLTIATSKAWPIHQLDINNAFLHEYLNEEIYMLPADGYTKAVPGQVCKLRRSLYGLKQASREWNQQFCPKLVQFGFRQFTDDHGLFIKQTPQSFFALLVHVDDVLIPWPLEAKIVHVKRFLDSVFTIKDLGYAKYFLGLEIGRSIECMYIHQRKYVLDIIQDVGPLNAKPTLTPMLKGHRFSPTSPLLSDPDRYRHLVGRLLYVTMTCLDVTYVVQQLSQHVPVSREDHWTVVPYFAI